MDRRNLYEVSAMLFQKDGTAASGAGFSVVVVADSLVQAMDLGLQFVKEQATKLSDDANPLDAVSLEGDDPISAEIRRASSRRDELDKLEWRPFKVEQMLEGRRVLVA